jgi:branched-chain amino acid aminotransferase
MNGVTRQNIINLCKENDIPIYEKNFSLVDVYSADEAFITGTLGSLTNVTSIDNRNIGKDNNPISDKLRNYYKKLL